MENEDFDTKLYSTAE